MRVHSWGTGIGVFSFVLVSACSTPTPEAGSAAWHRLPNAYATHFAILANGDQRALVVLGHGGERDTVGRYVLGPGGSFNGTAVPTTLTRVAILSTTHAAFFSALGCVDRIVAATHCDQVRDPALRAHIGAGAVAEVATGDGVDRERLLALRPQVVFGYPFGGAANDMLAKLGMPVVEVSEYLEEHPLGRAEWLRFFGVLLGKEREADSLFTAIRQRYVAIRVDSSRAGERPTVLFGSVWNGQWWVPPGNSYMARLIADAGGRYVFADRKGDGNIAVDMETMINVGGKADYWGMIAEISGTPTERDFTNGDPRLEALNAVREHHLFLGNSAQEDLFGQALVEPDVMLSSLLRCISDPRMHVSDAPTTRPAYFAGMFRTAPGPAVGP